MMNGSVTSDVQLPLKLRLFQQKQQTTKLPKLKDRETEKPLFAFHCVPFQILFIGFT